MSTYNVLIKRLNRQKEKIKDLNGLILKLSLNKERKILLNRILTLLETDGGIQDFEWINDPKQKKETQKRNKNLKIMGQFRYRVDSPFRVFTIFKRP